MSRCLIRTSMFAPMVLVSLNFLIAGVNSFQRHAVIKSTLRDTRLHPNLFSSNPLSFGISSDVQNEAVLDWSFIDGVYLITCPNGDVDGERMRKTKDILRNVGLLDRLQIKEFDTDDEDRIRGCYSSHISVMRDILDDSMIDGKKDALENWFGSFGAKEKSPTQDMKVLIIEDNLDLTGSLSQSSIDAVADYSQSGTEWDMIHLAYIPYVPDLEVSRTSSDKIVKLSCGIGSALGTTAYVINTAAMKTILEEDEKKGFYAPIPDVMAKLFPESRYAINPTIFVRAPKTKSLVNPQLDDLRELLFRPSVASFTQNILVLTGLSTNALLPLVIVLLLLTSLASGKLSFEAAWSLATTGTFDGPLLLPILSTLFTIFSLGIIAQGIMLAPKPPETGADDSSS